MVATIFRGNTSGIYFLVLKYEQLPHFYFLCGIYGLYRQGSSYVSNDAREDGVKWGLNIKASPRKGYSVHKEEIDLHKVRSKIVVYSKTYKFLECCG